MTIFTFESSNFSFESTLLVGLESLEKKLTAGFTVMEIENAIFWLVLIRFLILLVTYNLKTSFYMTVISLVAGFLWYKHLMEMISFYNTFLLQVPFLQKFGLNSNQLNPSLEEGFLIQGSNLSSSVTNVGQLFYNSLAKGIIHRDPVTGLDYYMDPISMLLSSLPTKVQAKFIPFYYSFYQELFPKMVRILSNLWNQLSGVAIYILVTRIGKRYCPYLIRWHWTFLLLIRFIEEILINFIQRMQSFRLSVLVPQTKAMLLGPNPLIMFQINGLKVFTVCLVLMHFSFILFALFHAVSGQYFYVPFLVENTELHTGPRPSQSIYSMGQTAWQNPEEKNESKNRWIPKLWYGWFGRGTKHPWKLGISFRRLVQKVSKLIKKIF